MLEAQLLECQRGARTLFRDLSFTVEGGQALPVREGGIAAVFVKNRVGAQQCITAEQCNAASARRGVESEDQHGKLNLLNVIFRLLRSFSLS